MADAGHGCSGWGWQAWLLIEVPDERAAVERQYFWSPRPNLWGLTWALDQQWRVAGPSRAGPPGAGSEGFHWPPRVSLRGTAGRNSFWESLHRQQASCVPVMQAPQLIRGSQVLMRRRQYWQTSEKHNRCRPRTVEDVGNGRGSSSFEAAQGHYERAQTTEEGPEKKQYRQPMQD